MYPGWKAKEIIRDAMLLRGGAMSNSGRKKSFPTRGMIDFLEEAPPADSVLAKALGDYQAVGQTRKDYYLLHEELGTFQLRRAILLELVGWWSQTTPVWSISPTRSPQTMFASNYGEKVAEPLLKECGHSQVLLEQYLDFVVNRTFRQSLLVHAERAPEIRYQVDRKQYQRLHFAAWVPPCGEEVRLDDSTQEFGVRGQSLTLRRFPTSKWPWRHHQPLAVDAVPPGARRCGAGAPDCRGCRSRRQPGGGDR